MQPRDDTPIGAAIAALAQRFEISVDEARENLPEVIRQDRAFAVALARLQALADVVRALNEANEAMARWRALEAAWVERINHAGPLN